MPEERNERTEKQLNQLNNQISEMKSKIEEATNPIIASRIELKNLNAEIKGLNKVNAKMTTLGDMTRGLANSVKSIPSALFKIKDNFEVQQKSLNESLKSSHERNTILKDLSKGVSKVALNLGDQARKASSAALQNIGNIRREQIEGFAGGIGKLIAPVFKAASGGLSTLLKALGAFLLIKNPEAIANVIKIVSEGFVSLSETLSDPEVQAGLGKLGEFLANVAKFGLDRITQLLDGIAGVSANLDKLFKGKFGEIDWLDFGGDILNVTAGFAGLAAVLAPGAALMVGLKGLGLAADALTNRINGVKPPTTTPPTNTTVAPGGANPLRPGQMAPTEAGLTGPDGRTPIREAAGNTRGGVKPGGVKLGGLTISPRAVASGAATLGISALINMGLNAADANTQRMIANATADRYRSMSSEDQAEFLSKFRERYKNEKEYQESWAHGIQKAINLGGVTTSEMKTALTEEVFMLISQKLRRGGAAVQKAQNGMLVPGSGEGDKIPAMLEPGEYVLNKKLVSSVGTEMLDRMNFGMVPRFQTGGHVEEYITGDTTSKQYSADHGGGNYHEHFGFSSKADRDNAIKVLSGAGFLIGSTDRNQPGSYHHVGQGLDIPFYPNHTVKGYSDDKEGESQFSSQVRKVLTDAGFTGLDASSGNARQTYTVGGVKYDLATGKAINPRTGDINPNGYSIDPNTNAMAPNQSNGSFNPFGGLGAFAAMGQVLEGLGSLIPPGLSSILNSITGGPASAASSSSSMSGGGLNVGSSTESAGKWGPLLNTIASVESIGGSYSSAYNPNGSQVIPGLETMSIEEAVKASGGADGSGKHYAIGRYQFTTLTSGQAALAGLSPSDPFSPENQDKMAIALITKKRGVTMEMIRSNPRKAQLLLSQEWAGLPKPGGGSYYDGDGVNASHMSDAQFQSVLTQMGRPGDIAGQPETTGMQTGGPAKPKRHGKMMGGAIHPMASNSITPVPHLQTGGTPMKASRSRFGTEFQTLSREGRTSGLFDVQANASPVIVPVPMGGGSGGGPQGGSSNTSTAPALSATPNSTASIDYIYRSVIGRILV